MNADVRPGRLRRLTDILHWDGTFGLLGRAFEALGPKIYYWLSIATDEPLDPLPLPAGCCVRELGAKAADDYVAFRRGATRAQFIERLRAGHRCLAVCHDETLIAVN